MFLYVGIPCEVFGEVPEEKVLKIFGKSAIIFIIFWDSFMDVLLNFAFTTSETNIIMTYKYGIYKLPHELPNDLTLRELVNITKCLHPTEWQPSAQFPCQNESFINFSKSPQN